MLVCSRCRACTEKTEGVVPREPVRRVQSKCLMTSVMSATPPTAHRRESSVVGVIFSSLKKRPSRKKRARRPVETEDAASSTMTTRLPVETEEAASSSTETTPLPVETEEAASSSTETTRLHLPSISPAQCHMLHFAQKERPHSPAKLPAGSLPRLQLVSDRHLLLLDLDHTLINTHPFKPTTGEAGIDWLKLELPRYAPTYVSLRPHLAEFVRGLQRLPYDLSVFTASSEAVATPKLDWLETRLRPVDPSGCAPPEHHGGLFSRRFFQEACTRLQPPGSQRLLLIKDLRAVLQPGADLARVLLIEDLPVACAWQPSNVVPIEPWWGQSTPAPHELTLTAHCPTRAALRATLHVLQATLATRRCQDCSPSSPTSPRVPTCARS